MNNQTKDSITDNATTESRPFKKTWEEPELVPIDVNGGYRLNQPESINGSIAVS